MPRRPAVERHGRDRQQIWTIVERQEAEIGVCGKLFDASGIGRLVDADMNEESIRLNALKTQQQLGILALSIADTQPDSVIQFFR